VRPPWVRFSSCLPRARDLCLCFAGRKDRGRAGEEGWLAYKREA